MESARFDRQYELYDYDGLFFVDGATNETMERMRSFVVTSDFQTCEIYGHTIEIKYSGRDANRWLVSWLKRLAEVVQNATGEITCTITTDERDPLFEFFRIADGKLLRQRGKIVRSDPERLV